MSLNQNVHSKIKFSFETSVKLIKFPILSGIQLFDPLLLEIDFFGQ
jgi:hypothetical protein